MKTVQVNKKKNISKNAMDIKKRKQLKSKVEVYT